MPFEKNIIGLQKHASELSQIIIKPPFHPNFNFQLTADWLKIASSVNRIEINTISYDKSTLFCSQGRKYESKRSKQLTYLTTQLAIFNFLWGAYESFVKAVPFKPVPENIIEKGQGRGNVTNRVCYHLKKYADNIEIVPFLGKVIEIFRNQIQSDSFYKKYSDKFKTNELVSDTGIGIKGVNYIRNDLAHGSAQMPAPDEWKGESYSLNNSEKSHPKIIRISSRIILLTIQMLLLTFRECNKQEVEKYSEAREEYYQIPIRDLIQKIHLTD